MYNTHCSLYDRSLEETPEHDFELSPAESVGVLKVAQRYLTAQLPQTLDKLR